MREISCPGNYNYLFSTYKEPIATVSPGETVCIITADAFEGKLKSEKQLAADVRGKWVNPQTGPIYINDTKPGDTLVVHILEIEPTCEYAWSCLARNFGGLVASDNTPMINSPLPEKTWFYKIQNGHLYHNELLHFDIEPFLGTIGTAPELEAIRSDIPFELGGNMDVPDVKPGNTIYLPIRVPGAYFQTGDCHAKQGQGEICGSAIEISAKVTLKFDVIKGKNINWPRIESPTHLMCVGNAKPLESAARIAYIELLKWMVELGWDLIEAYQCLTQVSEVYLGNLVDPNYSMVAKIRKDIAFRCMKSDK